MVAIPNIYDASAHPLKLRCAIYARYSSEVQRKTSIEDQIRICRAAAERNGWIVLDGYIRSDSELTGRTLVGRQGLRELIRLAKTTPRPFDVILIDDTSRFGRYLPDVLRECDILKHYGITLYFVSDHLDSRDEHFRFAYIIKGIGDEEYIRGLSKKVHRGQEGCILRGQAAGGSCYGYRSEPILDPNQSGKAATARILGVKRRIVEEEAAIIHRVMEFRAADNGYGTISKILNAEGVPAPERKYGGKTHRRWFGSAIKLICQNEIYHGVVVWNRKQSVFNVENGTRLSRRRPESEWVRVEVPELRIVSEELWERVQDVNRRRREKDVARRLGGMTRTESSRTYLFGGMMHCGVCGGSFTVVGGKAPYVYYGCRNRRFRQTCTARTGIRRERLEQQLLAAISKNLLDPRLEQERAREFSCQLNAAIEREQELGREAELNRPQFEAERSDLENQARNLVDAVSKHGMSSFLSAQLATIEVRLAEIERRLKANAAATLPRFTDEQIREFLHKESQDFTDALAGDPELARREIQKRIKNLVVSPKKTPQGIMLEVTGDVELLRSEEDVLLGISMEGISQHYTGMRISLAEVVLDPLQALSA
jgi:DNA invertase Pin-like site-specific DNA recombinase